MLKKRWRVDRFLLEIKIKNSSKYLPFLNEAKYVGSFFTIRTLKQNVEKTDERTGEIQIINDKVISIFSSKWNTCIYVAKKLNKLFQDSGGVSLSVQII